MDRINNVQRYVSVLSAKLREPVNKLNKDLRRKAHLLNMQREILKRIKGEDPKKKEDGSNKKEDDPEKKEEPKDKPKPKPKPKSDEERRETYKRLIKSFTILDHLDDIVNQVYTAESVNKEIARLCASEEQRLPTFRHRNFVYVTPNRALLSTDGVPKELDKDNLSKPIRQKDEGSSSRKIRKSRRLLLKKGKK